MKKNGTRKKNSIRPNGRASLFVPEAVQLSINSIQLAPYNPRYISPDKRAALRASVIKHGMVENLVVQKHSKELGLDLVLIGGHQRLDAVNTVCVEKGWEKPTSLPCVVLDVDDSTAKQLNIALNSPGLQGEYDPYKLGEVISSILPGMTADDVLATGFSSDQLQELVRLTLSPEEQAALLEGGVGDLTGFANSITLSIEFDTAAERDKTKELLKAIATARGKKAGKVVADALAAIELPSKKVVPKKTATKRA